MRYILVVILAVGLASCSSSAVAPTDASGSAATVPPALATSAAATVAPVPASEPVAASTAEPTPAPTAEPTPAPKPIRFSGSTGKKTTAFVLGLPARVEWTHAGDGNFIVFLQPTDGGIGAGIANEIGPNKVTTWLYGSGQTTKVYFDVLASGPWTIVATPASPTVATLPVSLTGTTGQTTSAFHASGDATVNWSHQGDGNFIVSALQLPSGELRDIVVNEIGKGKDTTQLYGLDGDYAFDVTASGAWTIAVSSP